MYKKIIYLFASMFAHIAIHELGHIVGGGITGYSLVSTQIGSIRVTREGSGWRLYSRKPFVIGRTYMVSNNSRSYILYTLGGVAFNIIFSIATLLIPCCLSWRIPRFCRIFSIMGIIFAFGNIIPFWNDGLNNDGNAIYVLRKNRKARKDYFTLLQIERRIIQGEDFLDMEEYLFQTDSRDNIYSIELIQDYSYYLLLKDRFEEQSHLLKDIQSSREPAIMEDECIYRAMAVENLLMARAEHQAIEEAIGGVDIILVNKRDPVLGARLKYELSLWCEDYECRDKSGYYTELMSIIKDIDNRTDYEIAIKIVKKCREIFGRGKNDEIRNKKS